MNNLLIGFRPMLSTQNCGGNALNSASTVMLPTKKGQLVRFHTPYPDEDPKLIYNLLYIDENILDDKRRAHIQEVVPNQMFVSINTVYAKDLEVVVYDLRTLVGHRVTIKNDKEKIHGTVIRPLEDKFVPVLELMDKGVETNVRLVVRDKYGEEHEGFLYVQPGRGLF